MERLPPIPELLEKNPLYLEALTHSSYGHEEGSGRSYDRLEFLGDAVLEMVVSEWLFRHFPNATEGEMTRWRAALVCQASLAEQGERLGLGGYLRLGRGEEGSGGRERPSLLADVYEAFIGALYLDRGIDTVRQFLSEWLSAEMRNPLRLKAWDPKSRLQELSQERGLTPVYRLEAAEGPDHRKLFRVSVWLGERMVGSGEGRSKKEAEREAALAALQIAEQAEHPADDPGSPGSRQPTENPGAERV